MANKSILLKLLFSFLVSVSMIFCMGQNKPGTSFYGNVQGDPNVCPQSANYLTSKDIDDMITKMLAKFGIKNRYIIKACPQVDNCQATLYNGKPYILYNPEFLNKVKRLNFSNATLPDADSKDWETLTILAHELGHHTNNHLINPLPDATQRDMELEADQTAGFIVYLLGGTLAQAQLAYYKPDVSIEGDYEHPPRQKRLESVAKGYNDAIELYGRSHAGTDTKFISSIKELLKKLEFDVSINDISAFENGEQFRNSIPYETLPTATECSPNVIKYYWKHLKDTRLSASINQYLTSNGLKDKFTKDSYLVYFFYNNKLCRIELRLYSDNVNSQKVMSALGQDVIKNKKGYSISENGLYYKTSVTEENGWINTHISISNKTGSTVCLGTWFDN